MRRVHLIDATWELFRSYFAAPSRRSPEGREVGAVGGLCASMLAMLRSNEVTHVGCATDHVIQSFRNDLYAGYKTGEGVEEDLLAQFEVAEEALGALGLVVWAMEELEADDALASAAERYRAAFDQVVIATPDKDLAQCVEGERIVQWDRHNDVWRTEAGVVERFGVPPGSIPDYLALVGDAADGIPGVPAWGAKSSATVLARYETIEAIPPDPETWDVKVRGARRLADSLAEHREEAALFKALTTLRRDAPIEQAPEDLAWTGVPRGPWEAFCERHGFARLFDRPHRWREEA